MTNSATIRHTMRGIMTRCVEYVGQRDREILGGNPI